MSFPSNSSKMKAVRLVEIGKPLQLQEIPLPGIGRRDVLVKIEAAGICHSDAHYRAGVSPVLTMPITLGHEVAGTVVDVGEEVRYFQLGQRVCLHYMVTCGECQYCHRGLEQFCLRGKMIGKFRDGGYAQYISVPARSVFPLPDSIPFDQGAVLMCSSSTSMHALIKARLQPGETVAVFGVGGLGISAVQLAYAFGAQKVFAVDLQQNKLQVAQRFGAQPVNPNDADPDEQIIALTQGRGVDVALEMVGSPAVARQALRSLTIQGRLALVGLTKNSFEIFPYAEMINREAEIIGVSDHLAQELPRLLTLVTQRKLDLSSVVTRTISLDPVEVNRALDGLDSYGSDVRVVIKP